MVTKRFALDDGGPIRLKLRYSMLSPQAILFLDGVELECLGYLPDLAKPKEYILDDGRTLRIEYVKPSYVPKPLTERPGLHVSLDGLPLFGSAAHPESYFLRIRRYFSVLSVLTIIIGAVLGIYWLVLDPDKERAIAYLPLIFFTAGMYYVCGYSMALRSKRVLVLVLTLVAVQFLVSYPYVVLNMCFLALSMVPGFLACSAGDAILRRIAKDEKKPSSS